MLVISRKIEERVLIGDNIEIVVVAIRGNRIRLGIEAPGLPIRRAEIDVRADAVSVENMKSVSCG